MSHHHGYIEAILAAILFGISTTLNKIVLSNVPPLIVAGLIYLIAGIVLLALKFSPLNQKILALLKTSTETEKTISRKDYIVLALVILSGSLIAPFLFITGLNETTAVNASLLLNTESLFTILIAFIFLKERTTKKDFFGMTLIFIGAIFVTTSGEFQKLELAKGVFGSMMVLGACLFWGIDNNLSRFLSKKDDLILVAALKCAIGGAILLLLAMFMGIAFVIPIATLPYIFTVGAFSIGISILLYLFALREIGAMKTGIIYSTSSLIGALFAFIILHEPFTLLQMTAGVSMLCGIYLIYRK